MDHNANRRLIEAIVKKAFHHLQEEPEREIRNLVDLGSMFASGKFQKEFFSAAESELGKKNSQYYKIVAQLIKKTDEDALLGFGINLGYNALTYGAKMVRDFENAAGHNVPWTLLLELSNEGKLDAASIDGLIQQGKKMGIFSYIFILQSGYSKLCALIPTLAAHDDCAFIIIANAQSFTVNHTAAQLSHLRNTMLGLDIRTGNDREIMAAAKHLRETKLLCASFYMADRAEYESINKAAQRAADFGFELVCILQDYSYYVEHPAQIKAVIDETRNHLDRPVLPIDIMSDILMVDRNISTEGCLAMILDNGEFYITNMETKEQNVGYNVIETPLSDILRHSLPKRAGR